MLECLTRALDRLYRHRRERLAVPVGSTVLFAALLLEDQHFCVAVLFHNGHHDARSFQIRPPHLNLPVAIDEQDPVELDFGPDLGCEFLEPQLLTGRGLDLLTTGFENRVQELFSHLFTVTPLFY